MEMKYITTPLPLQKEKRNLSHGYYTQSELAFFIIGGDNNDYDDSDNH